MRLKTIAFAAFALCALSGQAYTKIGLSFERTGTNAASVATKVVDQDGQEIQGASATVTSSVNFKATGANVTDKILCFDVNGNTSPTITFTVTIAGLTGSTNFSEVGTCVHALNGGGSYQQKDDGKQRKWNVDLQVNDDAFGTLSDIDIAAGVEGLNKFWSVSGTGSATTTLKLTYTITKGSANEGCFFGISDITVGGNERITPQEPVGPTPLDPKTIYEQDGSRYYKVFWYGDTSSYLTQQGSTFCVAKQSASACQYWQFIPTSSDKCFYIKNAVTGDYVQSCNYGGSIDGKHEKVAMGKTPVEYYVVQNSSLNNAYRMSSTDCKNYKTTSSNPFGINKDGASENIVIWYAGNSNTGSYWYIEETEFDFEQRPFTPSVNVGQPVMEYAMLSADGTKAVTLEGETLSWQPFGSSDNQIWYFVGSKNTQGYKLVNKGANKVYGTYSFLSNPDETQATYAWCGTYNDISTALKIGGETMFVKFIVPRSSFSRSAQIYQMPCGTLGSNYVSKLEVTGEGAMKTLNYPADTWSGKNKQTGSSTVSSWYTIFTTDKARVARDHEITVKVNFKTTPAAGYALYAYFDWNHDGVFETCVPVTLNGTSTQFTTTVPADAKSGESRMRLRFTDNGLDDAEDEVTGQILDCIVITEDYAEPSLTLKINDWTRGEVYSTQGTGNYTCHALPCGDSKFLCWLDGKKVVSTNSNYTLTIERPTTLTGVFSVNNTNDRPTTGIHSPVSDTPYAQPRYFDLQGREIMQLQKGVTYIRKTSDAKGEIFVK